jgi:hypothetical protein
MASYDSSLAYRHRKVLLLTCKLVVLGTAGIFMYRYRTIMYLLPVMLALFVVGPEGAGQALQLEPGCWGWNERSLPFPEYQNVAGSN